MCSDKVYIPSCWNLDEINKHKHPSKYTWASYDEKTGEYKYGEEFYDADMNKITEEEYERLTKEPEE